MTKVKICGLSTAEQVQAAVTAGADWVGFVHFPPSPRHVSLEQAAALKRLLPPHIQSVIVVVDAEDMCLQEIIHTVAPDYIQLHGHESVQRVAAIRRCFPVQRFIKALAIRNGDDVARANAYIPHIDMLLFDAKPPENASLPGGNGLVFDWALLKNRNFPLPWLLSGGLDSNNVSGAICITGAAGVDVSSGVESAAGVKDAGKIHAFIQAARK